MKKNPISIIATAISIILLIAGTVGLILLQKPLREESQDIRKDASVSSGQVSISSSPTSGSNLEINQDSTINFKANTNGVQTDGVQLVFNLITNTITETPTISVVTGSGLQNAYSQIEKTSDGYLVSVIAIPQQIGATFSSSSPTAIAQLTLKTASAGDIEISFDREKSKSIIHNSNPPEDTLTHVSTLSFTVGGGSIDPSPTPDVSPSPNVSPSPTPDATPGTGGITIQGCNDSCSSNAECEVNNRCYNGQCRLVTNVSSTNCTEISDQGLSFSCNEYCSDSNECDNEYTCLENKCRRSDNPDDSYCRVPSSTVQNNIASSCNTTCGTNADCAANLRCYYGACRLATNVSSTTCAATTAKTVSKLYDSSASKGSDLKGGDLKGEDMEATDSTIPAAIISKPSPSPMSNDSMMPIEEDETALDAIANSLQNSGVPINLLPIIALGLGGLILLLIIIPKIFGKKPRPVVKMPPASKEQQQQLRARIDELKKQPATPAVPHTVPPLVTPVASSKPTSNTPKSSMMERIKKKGVNPPNS